MYIVFQNKVVRSRFTCYLLHERDFSPISYRICFLTSTSLLSNKKKLRKKNRVPNLARGGGSGEVYACFLSLPYVDELSNLHNYGQIVCTCSLVLTFVTFNSPHVVYEYGCIDCLFL